MTALPQSGLLAQLTFLPLQPSVMPALKPGGRDVKSFLCRVLCLELHFRPVSASRPDPHLGAQNCWGHLPTPPDSSLFVPLPPPHAESHPCSRTPHLLQQLPCPSASLDLQAGLGQCRQAPVPGLTWVTSSQPISLGISDAGWNFPRAETTLCSSRESTC